MNAEVKATSNKQGLVSFGKIPRGTYHMKETVTPEGYKKLTIIYTVVVDGTTPIANVVHSDDDGGIIIADVEGMKLTKELVDGATKNEYCLWFFALIAHLFAPVGTLVCALACKPCHRRVHQHPQVIRRLA